MQKLFKQVNSKLLGQSILLDSLKRYFSKYEKYGILPMYHSYEISHRHFQNIIKSLAWTILTKILLQS